MQKVIDELAQVIRESEEGLARMTEAESQKPLSPGKWSRKQIIGHLIDSAANNHQRFVRVQLENHLSLPRYAQEDWVACQDYQHEPWTDLLALWRSYNLHLRHLVSRIPEDKLSHVCTLEGGETVTLGFLVEDYVAHLKQHLKQAG